MTDRDSRWSPRGLLVLALLALTLGAAACGDDDDGDNATAGQDDGQPQDIDTTTPLTGTPKEQITAAYDRFTDVYYTKDPDAICALLSRKGQRDWAKKAESCEQGVKKYFDSIQMLSKTQPKVVDVRVDGSRALAKTQIKGGGVYPVPFIKEDGEWKPNTGGAGGS
jgi:hypothetical protein